jgi:lipoprotein-releasing system permease protein
MFSAFEWTVATRYLRARRQEGFISVIAWFSLLGIMLGVATLIIVMSVMNGFRQEMLTSILGVNGHVTIHGSSASLPDYGQVAEAAAKVEGVRRVTPIIEGQVMATGRGNATGAVVRGIGPEDFAKRPILANNIVDGKFADFRGNDAVLVGERLARDLGLRVGDKLTLISPQGNVTALGTVPRERGYRIVGLFKVGNYLYDSRYVFMPLDAAQIYFKLPAAVTYLDLVIDDPDRAVARARAVYDALGPRVRVYPWQASQGAYFNAVQVERNVMFVILTLIIVVAAFNVISSMIMLVKDKSRDIAILRTMGATRRMILRIFFIAGSSIGAIGTFAGFVLGLVFASNIDAIGNIVEAITGTEVFAEEVYFLSRLPAVIDPGEVATVVILGLALSIAATIYPSIRAARLDPVEALRYE